MAEEWTKKYTVTRNGQKVDVNLKTPTACCKSTSTGTGGGSSGGVGAVVDKNCAENPTDANSNWKTVTR